MKVVLASQSPRRLALLRAAGLDVEVAVANLDERPKPSEPPAELVARLAREKAGAIGRTDVLVVAADTEVVCDGAVLGKPADAAAAHAMLSSLAGRAHDVMTGFCVRCGGEVRVAVIRTAVWFRPLAADEIAAYVATGEPFDKAGGYGIQGAGGALVDRIEGSYTNVVGLPLREVLTAIREIAGLKTC